MNSKLAAARLPAALRGVPLWTVAVLIGSMTGSCSVSAQDRPEIGAAFREGTELAKEIDGLLRQHWQRASVEPAQPASDRELFRRASLDLLGRVPTAGERQALLSARKEHNRGEHLAELFASPEFPLHFGGVLDRMLQEDRAGDAEFVNYLRRSVRDGKPWDHLFREMMIGPWETPPQRPANRFLDQRAKDLETLTADVSRAFFGVDITCAKCHDHPLVADWTQAHFYGMASFFNRTTGGKGKVGEKTSGEVKYLAADGQERVAQVMFLNGQVITEPERTADQAKEAPFSRRAQLVTVALEDKRMLSRALVNRVWRYFLGQGLVEPVDQLHSSNPAAIPELLDFLTDDFIAHGFDLRRLVAGIVQSRAYQLSSEWSGEQVPAAELFAVARLRPLSPAQYARSVVAIAGPLGAAPDAATRSAAAYLNEPGLAAIEQFFGRERAAQPLLSALDPLRREFQSSAGEALFLSNNAQFQQLLQLREDNLTARLRALDDPAKVVAAAVVQVLGREPEAGERDHLEQWIRDRWDDPEQACQQLVWALLTSAEFRFNF